MFIDEAELDDFQDRGGNVMPKYSGGVQSGGRSANGGRTDTDHFNMHEIYDNENDDDGLPPFRSAGGLSTPSSSRARMLAQQRELQLKKRQNNMLSTGMVRSSVDTNLSASTNGPLSGSPARQSVDSQFTPAVRQFSAPKSVRDNSNDAAQDHASEFSKRGNSRGGTSKGAQNNAGSRDRGNSKSASRGKNRHAYSDEEEEEDDDDYEEDARYRRRREVRGGDGHRRGGRDRENRDYNKGRHGRSNNQYDENDDDYYYERDDGRNRTVGGKERKTRKDGNRSNYNDDDYYEDNYYNGEDDGVKNNNSNWVGAGSSPGRAGDNAHREQKAITGGITKKDSPMKRNPGAQPMPPTAITTQMPPDLSDMRRFLTTPLPKECGIVQCYIRRNKSGTNKLFPIYSLYLKENDVFLMASKKRPNNKTSNYLITSDQNDLNRTGRGYLGKLRSNFVGTEFQIYDDGVSPKGGGDPDDNIGSGGHSNSSVRCEMAAVMYAANVLGSRGPRKMQVALPGLDDCGAIIKWRDGNLIPDSEGGGPDDILTRMKDRNMRGLNYLINKPPRWNEQVGAYVLNFNGRVTMASVKNFQLVDPDEQNAVVLQFGRVGKDEFTMDMQHPISPFQAFAVTLSSFDSKIACD